VKIIVFNPNTLVKMTKSIAEELEGARSADTELFVTNPTTGPQAVESAYDEVSAACEVTKMVSEAEADGFDAAVIACFSDPGLEAAREIAHIPVIGIGETAHHIAAMLGYSFSIITVAEQRIPHLAHRVMKSGLKDKLASIVPLGLTVADTEHRRSATRLAINKAGLKAVNDHKAEVLILACAGMGRYTYELEQELGVPVLSPTAAGLKMAETIVSLNLSHSKIRMYKTPSRNIIRTDTTHNDDGNQKASTG
jgi:allantoin racemase|tara:strand:- start:10713 stop:11468 length:756 start_codon:yes stop_codon:yes gene_type:complete